ncbi:hypothetical protein CUD01_25790 [Cellulomonas uda]|uniref:Uncharacterized protein n=1 Tax=Cellulomonas uda TaxID=1714 RepID=A0A4Y3KGD8_CELUD|nr:hypothetical protein CUD01_25790 [Cellulomonas uda]
MSVFGGPFPTWPPRDAPLDGVSRGVSRTGAWERVRPIDWTGVQGLGRARVSRYGFVIAGNVAGHGADLQPATVVQAVPSGRPGRPREVLWSSLTPPPRHP